MPRGVSDIENVNISQTDTAVSQKKFGKIRKADLSPNRNVDRSKLIPAGCSKKQLDFT